MSGSALEPTDVQVVSFGEVDGWALLSSVGHYLSASNPDFDVREYGYAKLGELVRAQPYVEVKEVSLPSGVTQLHVRLPRAGRSR